MTPTLQQGRLVVASGMFGKIRRGDIIVVKHDGTEKIKRASDIRSDTIFVTGDNPNESTDSRQFGWIDISCVIARVLWPRNRL